MEQHSYPGLQISEDLRQQKLEWSIQRIAWTFFALFLLSVLFGLLGKGPLSDATLGSSEGPLEMRYQRFVRYQSPQELRLTINAPSGRARVMVDSEYARQMQIQSITPQPEQTLVGENALVFVFNTVQPGPNHIVFYLDSAKAWKVNGWISLEGEERQEFSQFVYP